MEINAENKILSAVSNSSSQSHSIIPTTCNAMIKPINMQTCHTSENADSDMKKNNVTTKLLNITENSNKDVSDSIHMNSNKYKKSETIEASLKNIPGKECNGSCINNDDENIDSGSATVNDSLSQGAQACFMCQRPVQGGMQPTMDMLSTVVSKVRLQHIFDCKILYLHSRFYIDIKYVFCTSYICHFYSTY